MKTQIDVLSIWIRFYAIWGIKAVCSDQVVLDHRKLFRFVFVTFEMLVIKKAHLVLTHAQMWTQVMQVTNHMLNSA